MKYLKYIFLLFPVFCFAQSKPVYQRTPDGPNIIADANLKASKYLIVPISNISGIPGGSNVDSAGYLRYNQTTKTFQGYYGPTIGWSNIGIGTVSSITPGIGFTNHTPITSSGTMDNDTVNILATKYYVTSNANIGSGTANYLVKYTGTNTQAISGLYQGPTWIGYGYITAPPLGAKFGVNGSGYFNGNLTSAFRILGTNIEATTNVLSRSYSIIDSSNLYTATLEAGNLTNNRRDTVSNQSGTFAFVPTATGISTDSVQVWRNGVSYKVAQSSIGGGTVTGGTITWPGTIYSTPTTGTISSGVLNFSPSLNTQSAHAFLIGPSSGGSATPTFRTIVNSDAPLLLPYIGATNDLDLGPHYVTNSTSSSTSQLSPSGVIVQQLSSSVPTGVYSSMSSSSYQLNALDWTSSFNKNKLIFSDLTNSRNMTIQIPAIATSLNKTQTFQDKTGTIANTNDNISEFTNDAGYLTAMPNLTGDVTSTGTATTYNNVVPANKGGAGTVNGILKANGSGTVSAATSGTDYEVPLTFTSPLSRSSNTISIPQVTNAVNGYLGTSDFNNFTNTSSTGLISFGGLSIAGTTTFNVGAIKGWIIDNETDPTLPTKQYINYAGASNVTGTYVLTNTTTYLLLSPSSTIIQQTTIPTALQRRQNIFLGQLGHANMTSIIQVFNAPDIALEPASQLRDIFQPIHLINSNIATSANGANLSFNLSAGTLYGLGIGMVADVTKPNSISVSAQTPTTFQYRTQTGGTASNVTVIDPTNYDVSGTITAISGGNNQSTNQRIFLTQTGIIRVQYGQTIYSSLANAVTAAQTESFVTFSNFEENAILIGILSVRKGATALNSTSDAVFTAVSKFGEATGGTNGIATTTLQQAYNNSVTPEITTSTAIGAVDLKRGSASDGDNVFRILNGAGTATAAITGAGNMTLSAYGTGIAHFNSSGVISSSSVANADLANSAITLNGTSTSLGGSFTVTKNNTDTTASGFATKSSLIPYQTKAQALTTFIQNQTTVQQSAGFNINGSGVVTNIGINTGTTTPLGKLQIVETGTSSTRGIVSDQYSTDNTASRITQRKARGTFASPTAVANADNGASYTGSMYDGSTFLDNSKLLTTVKGTVSTGIIPSIIKIQNMNSGGVLKDALLIDTNQNITNYGITPMINLQTTGDGQNASMQRSTTLNRYSQTNYVSQPGGIGNAVTASSSSQYFTGSDAGLPSGSSSGFAVTISQWVKYTSLLNHDYLNYGNLFIKRNFSSYDIIVGGSSVGTVGGMASLGDGLWHNVVVVIDGTLATVYVDNIAYSSSTLSSYTITLNGIFANSLFNTNQYALQGPIDQLLVYNRVLSRTSGSGSPDEISAIYSSGIGTLSIPTSGLIRRYEFETGSGTTAFDTNPNATQYNVTLTGGLGWAGVGNGKVPTTANANNNTYLQSVDGVSSNENGRVLLGETATGLSGIRIYGQTIKHLINGYIPFVQDNSGRVLIDPANTNEIPTITGNLTIGAGTTTAPGLVLPPGTNSSTIRSGAIENDGTSLTYANSALSRLTIATTTSTQSFTNHTFSGSTNVLGGVTMTLTSDAPYDTWYRNNSGILTRLANGGTGALYMATASAAPSWLAVGATNTVLHGGTTPSYSNIVGGDLSSTIALPSGATATTQSANDNSTKLSTTAYTDAAITAYKTATAVETNKDLTSGTNTFPTFDIRYNKTIFTPTTGGTVNLVNKQYNIINPSGALATLTVNLPSSPNDGDVVYIKFTQNVTTVTYGNGTVVDGITAPTAGGLTILVYDSGTTSWY